MATTISPGDEVFLDTSYAVALAAESDQLHARAAGIAGQLAAARARVVTTRAVLLEVGNALSRRRYRATAIDILRTLEADREVRVVEVTEELFARGFALYASRPDKEWGLVDCISFRVMADRGLTKALTADEHFVQCGFRALLREAAG